MDSGDYVDRDRPELTLLQANPFEVVSIANTAPLLIPYFTSYNFYFCETSSFFMRKVHIYEMGVAF